MNGKRIWASSAWRVSFQVHGISAQYFTMTTNCRYEITSEIRCSINSTPMIQQIKKIRQAIKLCRQISVRPFSNLSQKPLKREEWILNHALDTYAKRHNALSAGHLVARGATDCAVGETSWFAHGRPTARVFERE